MLSIFPISRHYIPQCCGRRFFRVPAYFAKIRKIAEMQEMKYPGISAEEFFPEYFFPAMATQ
jgi:hypothetical protein